MAGGTLAAVADAFGKLPSATQLRIAEQVGVWDRAHDAKCEADFAWLVLLRASNWGRVRQMAAAIKREEA